MTCDLNGRLVAFLFDLCNNESSLFVGLDLKCSFITNLIGTPHTLTLQRETDRGRRELPIYLDQLNRTNLATERASRMGRKLRLDVMCVTTTLNGLMVSVTADGSARLRSLTLAKRRKRKHRKFLKA